MKRARSRRFDSEEGAETLFFPAATFCRPRLLMKPVAPSSRMFASTRGSPVLPSFHLGEKKTSRRPTLQSPGSRAFRACPESLAKESSGKRLSGLPLKGSFKGS